MRLTFQNTTVTVRRLKVTSGNKRQFYATATADGNIQNMDPSEQDPLQGVAKKQYVGYFDIDTDIREGDRLTEDATGRIYIVISTEKIGEGLGLAVDHLEVIMQKHSS